jgi:hypothetical protein
LTASCGSPVPVSCSAAAGACSCWAGSACCSVAGACSCSVAGCSVAGCSSLACFFLRSFFAGCSACCSVAAGACSCWAGSACCSAAAGACSCWSGFRLLLLLGSCCRGLLPPEPAARVRPAAQLLPGPVPAVRVRPAAQLLPEPVPAVRVRPAAQLLPEPVPAVRVRPAAQLLPVPVLLCGFCLLLSCAGAAGCSCSVVAVCAQAACWVRGQHHCDGGGACHQLLANFGDHFEVPVGLRDVPSADGIRVIRFIPHRTTQLRQIGCKKPRQTKNCRGFRLKWFCTVCCESYRCPVSSGVMRRMVTRRFSCSSSCVWIFRNCSP